MKERHAPMMKMMLKMMKIRKQRHLSFATAFPSASIFSICDARLVVPGTELMGQQSFRLLSYVFCFSLLSGTRKRQ